MSTLNTPGREVLRILTSAPDVYDGFSARTLRIVGRDTINGNPVREVELERRDYDWLTQRYLSGCHRYTSDRCPLEMYVRFGDWVLEEGTIP